MTPPFKKYFAEASEEEKHNLLSMIPLGRLGEPEEYASLASICLRRTLPCGADHQPKRRTCHLNVKGSQKIILPDSPTHAE